MIRPFITSLLLAASLLAQEVSSTPLPEEQSCTPLSVCDYAALLKAVASASDTHELYQNSMSHQIGQVPTKNGFDYFVVTNQKNEPMHHITDFDAMRYCNWRDHDSPTTGDDLEDSTEHGSYELNNSNQVLATDHNAPYQLLYAEHGFSIIYLAPTPTTTSPLMMFGETDGEKQEEAKQKQEAAEQQEEAGRRESEVGNDTQASSSLAARGLLNNAGPKENFPQDNTSSTLVSSRYPKTSQGPSLIALLKTGVVAALLHTAQMFSPVMAQEAVEHRAIPAQQFPDLQNRDFFDKLPSFLTSKELTPEERAAMRGEIPDENHCPGGMTINIKNGVPTMTCTGGSVSKVEQLDQEYGDALKKLEEHLSLNNPSKDHITAFNKLIGNRKAILRVFKGLLAEVQTQQKDLSTSRAPDQLLPDGSIIPSEPTALHDIQRMTQISNEREREYQETINKITNEIESLRSFRDRLNKHLANPPSTSPSISLEHYLHQRIGECALSAEEGKWLFALTAATNLEQRSQEFSISCESLRRANNYAYKMNEAGRLLSGLNQEIADTTKKTIDPRPALIKAKKNKREQEAILTSFLQQLNAYIDESAQALEKKDKVIELLQDCILNFSSLPKQFILEDPTELLILTSMSRLNTEAAKKSFLANQYKNLSGYLSKSENFLDAILPLQQPFETVKEAYQELHEKIETHLQERDFSLENKKHLNSLSNNAQRFIGEAESFLDTINFYKDRREEVNQFVDLLLKEEDNDLPPMMQLLRTFFEYNTKKMNQANIEVPLEESVPIVIKTNPRNHASTSLPQNK